jgi:hypothetical protein
MSAPLAALQGSAGGDPAISPGDSVESHPVHGQETFRTLARIASALKRPTDVLLQEELHRGRGSGII